LAIERASPHVGGVEEKKRVQGRAAAAETEVGWTPRFDDLDWTGSDVSSSAFERLMRIDPQAWHAELAQHEQWLHKLRVRLPHQLALKRELLALRFPARHTAAR
jgi:phosphoenolpyruvate carboxykinase (GTP)